MTGKPSPRSSRALLIVCSAILAILAIAALHLARAVLIPVALAVLLAFVLAPLVGWLERRGLGRLPSVLAVGTLVLLFLGGIGVAVTLQLKSLADDLPTYQKNVVDKIARLREAGKGTVLDKVNEAIDSVTGSASRPALPGGPARKDEPVAVRVTGSGFADAEAVAGPVLEVLATAVLVAVLVAFTLVGREDLRDRLIRLLGRGQLTDTTRALDDAGRRMSRFLLTQLLINAGFGAVLGFGVYLVGVPYPLLWGLLAGGLRFVPYLGSALAAAALMTFSVAAFPGWTVPLTVLAVFAALELTAANVAEPMLQGRSTGVSPVALLAAAGFWAWLWGPAGLLLSTPLTMCLAVLGRHVPGLRFLEILLGDRPALATEVRFYQRLLAGDREEATRVALEHAAASPAGRVYDDLLVPALTSAKRDRDRDALTADGEQAVLRLTREIAAVLGERRAAFPGSRGTPTGADEAAAPAVSVLGFPAWDEADRLALDMLRQVLDPGRWRLEVASADLLTGELVTLAGEREPAAFCIGSLPPGGLAQGRHLCKRLRAEFPGAKIVVGRWGLTGDVERDREQLLAAGADRVTTTLLETEDLLRAWLPVFSQGPAPLPSGGDTGRPVATV